MVHFILIQFKLNYGHNNGMIIFKLKRERPVYAFFLEILFIMFKEKYLRRLEITTSKDVSLMKLRNDPRVPSQSDNSIYDLYTIPKDAGELTSSTQTLDGMIYSKRKKF
ncbi:unnamed protein product [Rotaria sp. Silwood1]|nr:unnamed protein product [Rotaria sp. Silwood1]